ncbi:MAG: MFS transporter [Chloroflexota bacterium]
MLVSRLRSSSRLAVAAVIAAVFLGALDQTVIVAALPAVVTDLRIPFDRLDQAAWIVSGYLLGYTVALPVMGRVADVRGRRLTLAVSLAIFAVGSLGCALSWSLASLVVARVFQAAGGGALLPVAIAVISDRSPVDRRALGIGIVGAIAEAGGVLGPLYGAAIISWLDWRWIFWINVPIALLLLAIAVGGLEETGARGGRIDLVGAGLIALALGLPIAGLAHEAVVVASLDVRNGLLALAAVALAGFVGWEARAKDPLLDVRLFRRADFAAAIVGGILLGGALIVAMVDVPLFAATILNASAADGGLLLMRLTAFIPAGAVLGGALAQRAGSRLPAALGFIVAAAGLGTMSAWGTVPAQSLLWESLAIAGLGFGLLIAPLATSAVDAGGTDRAASAAALFSVARLIGMTVGLSILTAWGLQQFDSLAGSIPLPLPKVGESVASSQARLAAYNQTILQIGAEVYHDIFLAAAAICVVGLLAAVFLRATRSA